MSFRINIRNERSPNVETISPSSLSRRQDSCSKKFSKYLPTDVTTICSPFFGGGSFELYCILKFGIKVFGYDLFEPLVTFWNCLLADPERLATIVPTYLPVVTKEQFYQLQRTFRQIEDPWERAAATYVLNRTSFSGSTVSGGFSPLEEDGRNGRFKESNVEFLRNFRVPEGMLSVEHRFLRGIHSEAPDEPLYRGSAVPRRRASFTGNRGRLARHRPCFAGRNSPFPRQLDALLQRLSSKCEGSTAASRSWTRMAASSGTMA